MNINSKSHSKNYFKNSNSRAKEDKNKNKTNSIIRRNQGLNNNNNHSLVKKKIWYPTGFYTRKKPYYYAESGLGFYYENNNIEQLKDLREFGNTKNRSKIPNFVEFEYIEDNQFAIIIEYCSNCEDHKIHTFHFSELYKNYARSLELCILKRFPFIKVILKPLDTEISKGDNYIFPKVEKTKTKFINEKYKEVRIGAFEIYLCYKKLNENKKKFLLYSKLQTKKFPPVYKILDKIANYMPKFTGEIILYIKEDNHIEERKEEEKTNLVEGLQINLYLLKNEKLNNIADKAWEDLQNYMDPRKRNIFMKEQKIKQNVKLFKINNSNEPNDKDEKHRMYKKIKNRNRPTSSLEEVYKSERSQSVSPLLRPISYDNSNNIKLDKTTNDISQNIMSKNISKNKTLSLQNHLIFKCPLSNFILDKEESDNLRGKLICTKVTDSEGKINLGLLPYDSYYIEVQETKQYKRVGLTIIFKNINLINQNCIKKYIGLYVQDDAFIELTVYETYKEKDGKEKSAFLPKAHVTIESVPESGELEKFTDLENKEKKLELEENFNSPGIFEHNIAPGRYLIKVEKKNYETIRQYAILEKGHNKISIEMTPERCTNLHILVYNYENFQDEEYIPINHVDVGIYKNDNEILQESITDKNGEVVYIVNKGIDFLTISINKTGFRPAQRIFIKNKDAQVNPEGDYEERLVFLLVKENFIMEKNCILCVTYSNLCDMNFDPNGIQINKKIKGKMNLYCFDGQKENGIMTTYINQKTKEEEEMYEQNKGEELKVDNEEEKSNESDMDNNFNNDKFEDIILFSLIIQTDELKVNDYRDKGFLMNGVERFGCQTIIYMPNKMYYITAPSYSQKNYCLWNLGWIDAKNKLFYQTNNLSNDLYRRISFFENWIEFLQVLLDEKIFLKIFEFFKFDKGFLFDGDRIIYEKEFIECMQKIEIKKDKETLEFFASLFKNENDMISFALLRKKIICNLKNFSDDYFNKSVINDDLSSSVISENKESNSKITENQ